MTTHYTCGLCNKEHNKLLNIPRYSKDKVPVCHDCYHEFTSDYWIFSIDDYSINELNKALHMTEDARNIYFYNKSKESFFQ